MLYPAELRGLELKTSVFVVFVSGFTSDDNRDYTSVRNNGQNDYSGKP
jgi:hypothetical protein